MNLTTATPVEIDTHQAELDEQSHKLQAQEISALASVHYAVGDRKGYRGNRVTWLISDADAIDKAKALALDETAMARVREQAASAVDNLTKIRAQIEVIEAEFAAGEAEYMSRPWTRAFLAITNGKGHVHSSQHCSTCNNGEYRTHFSWMTNYSDLTEAEVIADAGYRACTICYPNAPVGDENTLPTKMFSQDEIDANAARAVRAAEKAARLAKKIEKALTQDGSELVVRTAQTREYFKTEVAGRNWVVSQLGAYKAWGSRKDDEAIAIVLEALAAKRGQNVETVKAEIDAKVIQWVKRNMA